VKEVDESEMIDKGRVLQMKHLSYTTSMLFVRVFL